MAAANDPNTLLIPDDYPKSYLNDKFLAITAAITGALLPGAGNLTVGKPFFSGIQKHIAAAIAGGIIGKYLFLRRNAYLADKDAVLRHYIELHPDDFPVPERKYLKDVFKPWHPVR